MDLAEDADAVAATPHGGAAAGVVGGVGGRAGGTLKMDIYSPDVLENGLDGPLHGVEVHVLAVGAQGEYLGLVGQAILPSGQIDPGQLIEPGGLVAVVVVAGQDIVLSARVNTKVF